MKPMTGTPLLTILIFVVFQSLPALAKPDRSDHPLISAYEGSVAKRKDVKAFDEYRAFTGMDESGKQPTAIDLEGKVTKIIYQAPKERSVLEMFRNYENAVAEVGAEVIHTCNQKKYECAARYAGRVLQQTSDIHSISNTAGRYLLAKVEQDKATAYIAIAVGPNSSTIHVVEVKKMQVGMVSINANTLGEGIDARGYVVVEGIYFDTDKATLQPRSAPALEQMAKLLKQRTALSAYVVGHTDSVGSLAHNQTLSENRAKAVVDELVENHDINRDRLVGHGVGPLAPQASNADEQGRAKNRRVVLVAQ